MVIGSMIGSGIFTAPSAFGRTGGGFAALIVWFVAGAGLLALALVFRTLSNRKPELDTGVYAYAREGFGRYMGFNSAFGYWIGCCLADVVCLMHIQATLGKFIPAFGNGSTPAALVGASVMLWLFHLLVMHDMRKAAVINAITTILKVIPILVFIALAIAGFRSDVFKANFWSGGAGDAVPLAGEIRAMMLMAVFMFVGMEGANVFSRYARKRSDIGAATLVGSIGVFCLLVLVTMLSYGVLPRSDLAALSAPALGSVLQSIVGPWGWGFISIGLLISILGNYLAWSLLATEVLYAAARDGAMPGFLERMNSKGVPIASLWLTNLTIQFLLIVSRHAEHAFYLALQMTSSMMLVPYLLVAAYGVKLAFTGETYVAGMQRQRVGDGMRSAVAAVFAVAMLYTGGLKFLLLSSILYLAGTVLYIRACHENHSRGLAGADWLVFLAMIFCAAVAIYALTTGALLL